MKKLFVLYDGRCDLCRLCRGWLGQQAAYVPLHFIPLQSPEVGTRFPGIEAFHPEEKMVVISDQGEVWRGEEAWITTLWALRDFREWSLTLANPLLRPFARRFCEAVSNNRHAISRWVGKSATELRTELAAVPDANCANTGYCKPR